MYQKEIKTAPEHKPRKFIRFLRDAISGKHLLRTWKKWLPWLLIFSIVSLIIVYNEYSIDKKERRNAALQKQHDSIVVELRNVNEIIYTEDETQLRNAAQERGFVDIQENDYYIIRSEERGGEHE